MNRMIMRTAGVMMALGLSASLALAAPQKTKAKAAQCPVCHMFLAKAPTAKATVAMRLKKGGPVYYCCSHCKMPASMLVKTKGKM